MIFRPRTFRPVRFRPRHFRPDDQRGYRVYKRNTIGGADTLVAILPPGTGEYTITGGQASSEAFYYVRAVSELGREDTEPVAPKLRRVAFDGDGNLILPVPNAVTDLQLVPSAGGAILARWVYVKFRQAVAPAKFNVYVATGSTAFDLSTPTHQVTASGARRYEKSLGTFAHHTLVRCIVRSVSADDAEETSSNVVSAVADAQAPDAPSSIEVEVTSE